MKVLHSQGITSATDPGVSLDLVSGGQSYPHYERLFSQGGFSLRVIAMVTSRGISNLRETYEAARNTQAIPEWFSARQAKFYLDGVPTHAKTAWLYEPYQSGGTGGLVVPGDTEAEQMDWFYEHTQLAHDLGFQIGIHCTGDRAIDTAVDAILKACGNHPHERRHYIIHGDLTRPETLKRMGQTGIPVSFNPNIKHSLAHAMNEILGPERAHYQWPYRTALANGVNVSSASDAPVTFPNARQGLSTVVTRRALATGEVSGYEEAIDLDSALSTYTRSAAYQDHAETWKGQIAVGQVADFVIFDGDLRATPPEEVADLPISQTIVDDNVVFDAESDSSPEPTADTRTAEQTLEGYGSCCGH